MSDNLEIVMDIDTLEIFDVIDLDNTSEVEIQLTENKTEEIKTMTSESHFNNKSVCIILFDIARVFSHKNLHKVFEDSS
ncbi:hypothetical protein [Streptococcus thoraltensis]|uniref:hypothetical protein n=1 Tax=Streptococcus thoraltensis TaxID=55085 RepID=UPI001F5831BF|nr:hypothetical protein [Streptococcus thoraltensis]